MRNEISYPTIKAYLLGQLPPEQTKELEAIMSADPELAEEVEMHRQLLPALEHLKEQALHANFDTWKHELAEETGAAPKTTRNRILLLVLVLLAFLIAAWFFFTKNAAPTGEEVLSQPDSAQKTLPILPDSTPLRETSDETPSGPATPKNRLNKRYPPVAAVKKLADEWIAGINPAPVERTLGVDPADAWKTAVVRADSFTRLQQYPEALRLLDAVARVPEATSYRLFRQAYLYSRIGDHKRAIAAYKQYMEWDRNVDQTGWQLTLYYLAAFPEYQTEFWTSLNAILNDAGHPRNKDARRLADALAAAGVERH